jgi:shikimate kinase
MKIFMIGMPGSGKTVLGEELSILLELPYFELDEGIERETGMSISEIFSTRGEKYFRTIESKLLRSIPGMTEHFVLSTGGGAPCFFDNMNFMNEEGKTIFLNVPVKTIFQRLIKNGQKERPLLRDLSEEELLTYLGEQFDSRINFYEKAGLVLEGDNLSAQKIFKEMKKNGW